MSTASVPVAEVRTASAVPSLQTLVVAGFVGMTLAGLAGVGGRAFGPAWSMAAALTASALVFRAPAGFLVFVVEDFRGQGHAGGVVESALGLPTVAAACGLLGFASLSAVVLRAAHVGRCGIRPTAVTVCYASVLFLPTCLFLSTCLWVTSLAMDAGWFHWSHRTDDWGATACYWGFHILNAAPPIAAFTWAMIRLRRALKDVRFAVS